MTRTAAFSVLSSLMMGTAFVPADDGYAAAVDLPARLESLSGAGWVTSHTTVDQSARAVPMPAGTILKTPAAAQVAASTQNFGQAVAWVEANGNRIQMVRSICGLYFDLPPGSEPCHARARTITEGNDARSLLVLTEEGRGDIHVAVVHRDVSSGLLNGYGLSGAGALAKAVQIVRGAEAIARDIAEADRDAAPLGHRALMQYWSAVAPGLQVPPAG